MTIEIFGMFGGYVLRRDDGAPGREFQSEDELREYLRSQGIPDEVIADAIRTLNLSPADERYVKLTSN